MNWNALECTGMHLDHIIYMVHNIDAGYREIILPI